MSQSFSGVIAMAKRTPNCRPCHLARRWPRNRNVTGRRPRHSNTFREPLRVSKAKLLSYSINRALPRGFGRKCIGRFIGIASYT
jgi:hypothetical protein